MFPFSRTGLALCISFHTSTPPNDDKRISFTLVLTSQLNSRVTTGRLQQQHKFDSAISK